MVIWERSHGKLNEKARKPSVTSRPQFYKFSKITEALETISALFKADMSKHFRLSRNRIYYFCNLQLVDVCCKNGN